MNNQQPSPFIRTQFNDYKTMVSIKKLRYSLALYSNIKVQATPFKQKYYPYVCSNKDSFVPSKIFCSNTFQDSGCLCLTKKQASFMYNRGKPHCCPCKIN